MYVSPGFLSQQLTRYEKKRNRIVQENLQVLKEQGWMWIDEDYLPSNGEGRVRNAGPGKKKGPSDAQPLRKSQRTQEKGRQAIQIQPHTVLAEGMAAVATQPTQLPTSPTEQTNPFGSPHTIVSSRASSLIAGKKCVRGPTRGKNVNKMRKTLGHPIPVVINPETMSIEGKYATYVACAIGLNIRDHAPVRDIGWGDIDFGIRGSIILRVGVINNFVVLVQCIFYLNHVKTRIILMFEISIKSLIEKIRIYL
ncbi:hypothetical protein RHGRI_024095 [Rhododendron griersonianum]|uniref:Uncharacterized protein n=1 Tax=Rhododendron griersonianum TaxID=479676 RepID=A0AAV6J8A8_9ERIC|nr:hypothetical protein RHGRI_024095 [Rhododendron griersonianum]